MIGSKELGNAREGEGINPKGMKWERGAARKLEGN